MQTLITGCELYDGSTNAPLKRDVRVGDGRIVAIGSLVPERDDLVINARGLSLMPGIIQLASELDVIGGVAHVPLERAYAASGVTTAVIGLGGNSLAPYANAADTSALYDDAIGGWKHVRTMLNDLSHREHAINIATLVGGTTLDYSDNPEQALHEAFTDGAYGCSFSTGDPFVAGSPELQLARATAQQGRAVFFRPSLNNTLPRELEHALNFASTHHAFVVADDIVLPPHAPASLLSTLSTTLAREGSSFYALIRQHMSQLFPLPHFSRTHNALVARMQQESVTEDDMQTIDTAFRDFLDWTGDISVGATKKHSSFASRPIRDIAHEWDMSASSALALLNYRHHGGIAVTPNLHPIAEHITRSLAAALPRHSFVPLSHIWKSTTHDNADAHFASLIHATSPLERARMIAKLTSVPADILQLKDRGRITKGAAADMILFSPPTASDTPHENVIRRVFINGHCLYEEGKDRPTTAGRVLIAD